MNCDDAFDKLSIYAESELDEKDLADLREHVASCEKCGQRQEFLQLFQSKLRDAVTAEVECPSFAAMIVGLLPQRRRPARLRLALVFASTGVLAAALLWTLLLHPARPSHTNRQAVKPPSQTQRLPTRSAGSLLPAPPRKTAPGRRPIPAMAMKRTAPKPHRVAFWRPVKRPRVVHMARASEKPTPSPCPPAPAARKPRPVVEVMVTWVSPPNPKEETYGYTNYDSNHKPIEEFRIKKSGDSVEIFWEKSPAGIKQKSGGEDIEKRNRA